MDSCSFYLVPSSKVKITINTKELIIRKLFYDMVTKLTQAQFGFFDRFILNIHELVTIEMAMMCIKTGMNGFPLWSLYTIKISHFMLALNSSINIFIYFFLSSRFRQDCRKWYKRMKDFFRSR